MTTIAAATAFLLVFLDRRYLSSDGKIAWLYSGGSDGAKTLLATVAGSVITVAGVVFSITIAALTQASAQFGPRLLRNFMRDTANQVVLGTFVATFLYCLLVLRTIHDKFGDGEAFVPQASVTFAVLLAVASIAVLIFFIHHVSTSLQAPHVVGVIRRELTEALSRFPPAKPDESPTTESCDMAIGDEDVGAAKQLIESRSDGYVQAVDYETLVAIAAAEDIVFRIRFRAGSYIMKGQKLMVVSSGKKLSAESLAKISQTFITADHASAQQDLEYSIRQIVEIGVRALSPGINDPFTAVNCIDALGSIISRSCGVILPPARVFDGDGNLRIIRKTSTFQGMMDVAFNQLRQNAGSSVAVTIRLLEVIGDCAEYATSTGQLKALQTHLDLVFAQSNAKERIITERDREEVLGRWAQGTKYMENVRKRLVTLEYPPREGSSRQE